MEERVTMYGVLMASLSQICHATPEPGYGNNDILSSHKGKVIERFISRTQWQQNLLTVSMKNALYVYLQRINSRL